MSTLFNNSTLRDTVTSYFSTSRFEFKQYFYEMLLNEKYSVCTLESLGVALHNRPSHMAPSEN